MPPPMVNLAASVPSPMHAAPPTRQIGWSQRQEQTSRLQEAVSVPERNNFRSLPLSACDAQLPDSPPRIRQWDQSHIRRYSRALLAMENLSHLTCPLEVPIAVRFVPSSQPTRTPTSDGESVGDSYRRVNLPWIWRVMSLTGDSKSSD